MERKRAEKPEVVLVQARISSKMAKALRVICALTGEKQAPLVRRLIGEEVKRQIATGTWADLEATLGKEL